MIVLHDKINRFFFSLPESITVNDDSGAKKYYKKIINIILKNNKEKNKNCFSDNDLFEMHKRNIGLYEINNHTIQNYNYYGSYDSFLNSYSLSRGVLLKHDDISNDQIIENFFDMFNEKRKFIKINDNTYQVILKYIFINQYLTKYKTKYYEKNIICFIILLYYLNKKLCFDNNYDIFIKYINNLFLYKIELNKNKKTITLKNKINFKTIFDKIDNLNIDDSVIENICFKNKRKNWSIFTLRNTEYIDDIEIFHDILPKYKDYIINKFNEKYRFVIISDEKNKRLYYKKNLTKEKIKSFFIEYYGDYLHIIPSKIDDENLCIYLKINNIEFKIISYKDFVNLLKLFSIDYLIE